MRHSLHIHTYFLRDETITETKSKLDKYYKDSSSSMIHKWFTEFRCGQTTTDDSERSECPKYVTTLGIIQKIHDMILDDLRIKVHDIAKDVGISIESVITILHKNFVISKLLRRWVPRLLTIDQRRERMRCSEQCLALFKRNPNQFLRRFITVDEAWIQHLDPPINT